MSNEPGYYKEKHFGVRLENMMIVKKRKNKKYFENLTLYHLIKMVSIPNYCQKMR